MSDIRKLFGVCLGLLLLSSCAKTVPYTAMGPLEMPAVSKLAVELTEMVKKNVPTVAPYMNVHPSNVTLEHISGNDNFFIRNMVIIDADFSPDRIFSQQTLVESVDELGRIDLRDDWIALRVRGPVPDEVQTIAGSFKKFFSLSKIRRLSKTERAAFKEAIRTFQQDNGLQSDGIFGKNTAKVLASQTPVVDIQEVTSTVVYPSSPRHAIYIVPFSTVNHQPDQFYKGFNSLEVVKQNSIGQKDFARLAKAGARFTVFVYFFDRVDPYYPLSVRLSTSELKATGSAGKRWYADPAGWPVLVETFTLKKDPRTVLSSLYLSVCIEDAESSRCLSSRKLQ